MMETIIGPGEGESGSGIKSDKAKEDKEQPASGQF